MRRSYKGLRVKRRLFRMIERSKLQSAGTSLPRGDFGKLGPKSQRRAPVLISVTSWELAFSRSVSINTHASLSLWSQVHLVSPQRKFQPCHQVLHRFTYVNSNPYNKNRVRHFKEAWMCSWRRVRPCCLLPCCRLLLHPPSSLLLLSQGVTCLI